MKILSFIALLLFFNVATAENLEIGIKEAKPFAFFENGEWKGISVDLLDTLSKEQNFTYTLFPFETTKHLLKLTADGKVDMSIAAISITHEREKTIDFSHKYFTTSLGILSKDKGGWLDTTIWIAKKLFIIVIFFVIALYIIGFIMDKIDGDDNISGAHEGAWWALVTFTTTGYGDLVPNTNKGKVVASIWMISSLFLISIFTGYVSSALTVKKLTDEPSTLADLYKVRVVAVSGSSAQERLNLLGIKHDGVDSLSDAYVLFYTDKADVVVHDAAILNSNIHNTGNVSVWNIEDSDEDYAIALPPKSPLTERVNLGILSILASPEWKAQLSKYNVL